MLWSYGEGEGGGVWEGGFVKKVGKRACKGGGGGPINRGVGGSMRV